MVPCDPGGGGIDPEVTVRIGVRAVASPADPLGVDPDFHVHLAHRSFPRRSLATNPAASIRPGPPRTWQVQTIGRRRLQGRLFRPPAACDAACRQWGARFERRRLPQEASPRHSPVTPPPLSVTAPPPEPLSDPRPRRSRRPGLLRSPAGGSVTPVVGTVSARGRRSRPRHHPTLCRRIPPIPPLLVRAPNTPHPWIGALFTPRRRRRPVRASTTRGK